MEAGLIFRPQLRSGLGIGILHAWGILYDHWRYRWMKLIRSQRTKQNWFLICKRDPKTHLAIFSPFIATPFSAWFITSWVTNSMRRTWFRMYLSKSSAASSSFTVTAA